MFTFRHHRTIFIVGVVIAAVVYVVGIGSVFHSAQALDCGGVQTTVIGGDVCSGTDINSSDPSSNPMLSILKLVLQVLTGIVGIAAVGGLIWAGIIYGTAGGDASQLKRSKTIITDTIIGVVCYGGMAILINFFLPGGLFGQGSYVASNSSSTDSSTNTDDSSVDSNSNSNSNSSSSSSSNANTNTNTSGSSIVTNSSNNSSKKYSTVTITSWNVFYMNGAGDIKTGAKKIAQDGADLIGFQELNFPSSRSAVKDALVSCSGCNFDGYFPGSSGASGWNASSTVSLVWNKDMFTKLDQGQVHVSSAGYAGANTGDKWITWVKLKDKKTGVSFYFADTHLVAFVMKGASSVIKNYSNHVNKLEDFLNGKKIPIFIAGDFNMGYNYDVTHNTSYSPKRSLKKYGIYSNWELLNKKTSVIDYVWASKKSNVTPVSTRAWGSKLGSDHAPVTLTVKMYEN